MSQMLPEGGEVMRRVPCGDVCPAPPALPLPPHNRSSENKELLRQQLLSASKERLADKSEPPKQKLARNRQKNRWKLKFHHQALPQEYLDHYEESLQRASAKQPHKPKPPDKHKAEVSCDGSNITNETFKIWAQRLAGVQSEPAAPSPPAGEPPAAKPPARPDDRRRRNPAIAPSKIVTYDDLPYMGEMTLNNSKPRRGRKPKKADICHLIYENYGTVVPGQPPPSHDRASHPPPRGPDDPPSSSPRTDLQNRIISSLLERKLSQESRRRGETPGARGTPARARFPRPDEPMPAAPPTLAGPLHSDDEPLNLCIRDLHDLKIQIQRKFGNIYSSLPEVKAEPELEPRPHSEQPNAISVIQRNTNRPPTASSGSSPEPSRARLASPALSEPALPLLCWPGAPVYMHPLALQTQLLYYQRLAAGDNTPASPATPASLADTVSTGASSPLDDGKNKLVLKQISELLEPRVVERGEGEGEGEGEDRPTKRASPRPARAPAKRKRSAIFIPPIPTRGSSSTPTTEVSICKFKFTGGSKPSLQEKKMLSVDSGGNFTYYSGTGAKGGRGERGYDYLHRDCGRGGEPSTPSAPEVQPAATAKEDLGKKKRKSRKSLQREKLEQTFKEKGFLIQTQQLQSAEGATYCKFRQLRKFTRYLFRSWKDYLPGELEERPGELVADASPPADEATAEWG